MLNRIFLILAVVAGLIVSLVAQFVVRPHLQGIIEARNFNEQQWKKEERLRRDKEKKLKETEEKLVATETELKDTQTKLADETSRANTQEELATRLQKDLNDSRAKLTTAQQELAAWGALGLTVDMVKNLVQSEKELKAINEVLEAEKVVLTRENGRQDKLIKQLLGEKEVDPPLPVGTKGQVLVVDPKWKFVVLNLGHNQEMKENGVLMVSREGKLVAKVRISSVFADRCVANVMSGWEFGEIMEGDLVLTAY